MGTSVTSSMLGHSGEISDVITKKASGRRNMGGVGGNYQHYDYMQGGKLKLYVAAISFCASIKTMDFSEWCEAFCMSEVFYHQREQSLKINYADVLVSKQRIETRTSASLKPVQRNFFPKNVW